MTLTLGCDPELSCFKNNNFVEADNYFKSNSSFGLDGFTSIAEIRQGTLRNPTIIAQKHQFWATKKIFIKILKINLTLQLVYAILL